MASEPASMTQPPRARLCRAVLSPGAHRSARRALQPLFGLKARYYASLIHRNPWLLLPNDKTWNYAKYRLMPHRTTLNHTVAGPVFLSINVTRRCNLSCSFCVVGDSLNKPDWRRSEATVGDIRRLIAHPVARKCLYVMLTGGEPLLNRDIIAIVREIKRRRHLLGLTSNGILLRERMDELRAAKLDLLNLSLYEANRDALADVLPRACRMLYCKLVRVISHQDIRRPERIEDTLQLARQTGCRRVYFQNVLPHHDTDGLTPVYEDDADYTDVMRQLTQRYRDVSIHWPGPAPGPGSAGRKLCRMPWYLLVTDARGRLGFCCAHCVCDGASLHDMSVQEVMNGRDWVECRRSLLSTDKTPPHTCARCFVLNDSWGADV